MSDRRTRKPPPFWLAAAIVLVSCAAVPVASNGPSSPVASDQPSAARVASSTRSEPPVAYEQPTPAPVASAPRLEPIPAPKPLAMVGRGYTQLTYDTGHHAAVLFGGTDGNQITADTWIWDGRKWSLAMNDMAPPARMGGAFIYDPVRHVSVLFGGNGVRGWFSDFLNDTWTFDGSKWSQKSPTTFPNPRAFSAVAFDTRRGVVVLFGGFNADGGLNDLWTWDGTNWTQAATPASPPKLFPLGLAYRQSDDSLRVAGQSAPKGMGIYAAVQSWAYVNQTWREVTVGSTPPCLDHYGASAQDVQRGALVFFGGYCKGPTVEWDGSVWKSTTPNPSPPNRGEEGGSPAMTYDPDHHVVLMYGGHTTGSYFNDLWSWDGAVWSRLA